MACAVGAAALFSVNATVSKLVLQHGLSSTQLVCLRSAGAALLLMTVTAIRHPRALRVGRRELMFLAAYGLLGIAMVQWLYLVAIARMPVGVALLLEYTAPLLVALWVRFVRKEQVRARIWGALALSLGGLVLVAQVWRGLTLDGIGVLAALGSAVALAAYYLMGERGMVDRDPVSLMAWIFTFAAILWAIVDPWWTLPWAAFDDTVDLPGALIGSSAPVGVLVLMIVLLGTVAPFGLILLGVARIGPGRVGILCMLEPAGAGLVAWVVLGESLRPVQLVGAVVVLCGTFVAETARRRQHEPEPVPEGVTW